MNATDDNFPILVRRDEYPSKVSKRVILFRVTSNSDNMQLSASSAALDLASPQTPGPDQSGWSTFARHRPAQQSLPVNTVPQLNGQSSTVSNGVSNADSPINVRPSYRHSLDLKYFGEVQEDHAQVTSPAKHVQATPPKLQSSYSASDVPTMKSGSNGITLNTTPNSHAQQHFHNHNASLGRIPPNAMNNRQSRDLTGADGTATLREGQTSSYQTIQSALQASAPAFGPPISQAMSQPQSPGTVTSPTTPSYAVPSYYGNYNTQMIAMGMQNLQLGQPAYSPQNPYANYGALFQSQNGMRDSQSRVIQQRRQNDGEGNVVSRASSFLFADRSYSHESFCKSSARVLGRRDLCAM